MNTEHPTPATAIDFNNSTSLLQLPAGSAADSPHYHLDIVTVATKTLSRLGSSRDPRGFLAYLKTIPFDGRTPEHHRSFWQANFPSVFLDVISDQAWYASFAVDSPEGGPEISVMSEQSTAASVQIPLYTVRHRMIADLSYLMIYRDCCG